MHMPDNLGERQTSLRAGAENCLHLGLSETSGPLPAGEFQAKQIQRGSKAAKASQNILSLYLHQPSMCISPSCPRALLSP